MREYILRLTQESTGSVLRIPFECGEDDEVGHMITVRERAWGIHWSKFPKWDKNYQILPPECKYEV